jgi:hypothetical protein
MTLRTEGATKYTPVPAAEYLDQLHSEHELLITMLKDDLADLTVASDMEYVWNIERRDNIIAKANDLINRARKRIHIALLPATFPSLRQSLAEAIGRGIRTVLYTTECVDLPGGRVVVADVSEQALGQASGLGLVLVTDGSEVLIGERLGASQARASWTTSPLLVFVAEHHLRTDLYLPRLVAMLGDRALDVIHQEDQEIFIQAMESRIT